MPNHKTHERVGLLFTPVVVVPVSIWFNLTFIQSLYILVAYLFSNYFMTPDLDTDSQPYYRWSFLRFIWYPYKKLIPHRSVFSHSGPISGTLRFLYIGILVTALFAYFNILVFPYMVYVWYAIVAVDVLHTVLDFSMKGKKKE